MPEFSDLSPPSQSANVFILECLKEDCPMHAPAWILIVAGIALVAAGVVWLLLPSVPWLGRLPGDLAIERENFRFYFPLATCLLLSVLLTGLLWLVRYFSR